jgi:hypothetical protein
MIGQISQAPKAEAIKAVISGSYGSNRLRHQDCTTGGLSIVLGATFGSAGSERQKNGDTAHSLGWED